MADESGSVETVRDLIKILSDTRKFQPGDIVVGRATGIKPGGQVLVTYDGGTVSAIACSSNLVGDAIAILSDDGKWYAKGVNEPVTVSETLAYSRKVRYKASSVVAKFKAIFRKNYNNSELYVGLDRETIRSIAGVANNLSSYLSTTSLDDIRVLSVINTGKGKYDWYLVVCVDKNPVYGLGFVYPDGTFSYKYIDYAGYDRAYFREYANGLTIGWFSEPVVKPDFITTNLPGNSQTTRQYDIKAYTLTKDNAYEETIKYTFYSGSTSVVSTLNNYINTPIDVEIKVEGRLPLPNGNTAKYLSLQKGKSIYTSDYTETIGIPSYGATNFCSIRFNGDLSNAAYADVTQSFSSYETKTSYELVEARTEERANIWLYNNDNCFAYTVYRSHLENLTTTSTYTGREGTDTTLHSCAIQQERLDYHYTGIRTEEYYRLYRNTVKRPGLVDKHYLNFNGAHILLDEGLSSFTVYIPVNTGWKINPTGLTAVSAVNLYSPVSPLDYVIEAIFEAETTGNKTVTTNFSYSNQNEVIGDFRPNYTSDPLTTTENLHTIKQPNLFWNTFIGREIDAYLYIDTDTTYWYTGYVASANLVDTETPEYAPIPDPRNPVTRKAKDISLVFTGFKKLSTKQTGYSLGNPNFLIVESKANNTVHFSSTTVVNDKIYNVDYVNQISKKGLVFVYEVLNSSIRLADILEEKMIPVPLGKAIAYTGASYYP